MVIQGVTNLAIGASNLNVLQGSAFEFVKRPSRCRFYLVGPAAAGMLATVQSGSDVLMEQSPISRAARVPIVPDDITVEDVAMPGDRLKIALQNNTGAANDVFWRVEITEIR